MITVFKTMDSHGIPQYFEINEVLGRIKRGVNKQLIEQIRTETNKQKRDQLKKRLLWICFSGKFKARLNDAMLKHSGFICLDFDGMDSKNMELWRAKLKADQHTYSVFTSPSGNGLKAIWKIPECTTNEEHNLRFESIAEYWKECRFFDLNVKGWNRVCFESFDNNLYLNEASEIYIGINQPAPIKIQSTPVNVESDTEIDFKKVVTWFEKSHNMNIGNRNQGAFTFASGVAAYIPQIDGYQMAVNYISQHAQQSASDPFTINEIETCVKQAYKSTPIPTKQFDNTPQQIGEPEPRRVNFLSDPDEEEQDELPEKTARFWEITPRGALKLDSFEFRKWLQSEGFYQYVFAPEKINFIRVQENIIDNVFSKDIRKFTLDYLEKIGETSVYNMVAENSKLKDDYFALLDVMEPKFLKDDDQTSWFFYRNTAVKVTNVTIELVPYIDIEGCIWKSSKLDRDFKICKYEDHDFAKFLMNLSNKDVKRFQGVATAIGYLLHRYKNPSIVKVPILNDETLSTEPEGGTGKTLIFMACGQIRQLVEIDGKNFNSGKSFVWQRVNPDTDIVLIDDIPKNFKFENLFSIITTGWPVEKKQKGEIYLKPSESPKICIPTNNTLKGSTSSHKRRKFELEIYPHYSDDYQPIDDFGRVFWGDYWTAEDWLQFDNLMLNCCKLFLSDGLIQPEYVNLDLKKLIANTSTDFIEWAKGAFTVNSQYKRIEMWERWQKENPGSWCKSANMFYDWMRKFGEFQGWTVNESGQGRMYINFSGKDGELDY